MAKNPVFKSATGYRGVYKQGNRFNGQITSKGKNLSKMFGDPIEAAYWWDEQARRLRGHDTETNESLGLIPPRVDIIVKQSKLKNSEPQPSIFKGEFDPKPSLLDVPPDLNDDDIEDERQPACLCEPGYVHPASIPDQQKQSPKLTTTADAEKPKQEPQGVPIDLLPERVQRSLNPHAAAMRAEALRMLAASVELESKGDIRERLAPVYAEVETAINTVRQATDDMIEGLAMLEIASTKLKELLA